MPGPQAAAGIKQWFDGHDEHEDDGRRVRAMHGAGPSRHGAAVLSAGHRQGHEAGSATAVPLLQTVAKDHRRMAAPPSSKKFSSYIDRWNSQRAEVDEEAFARDADQQKAATGQAASALQDRQRNEHSAASDDKDVEVAQHAHLAFDYTDEGEKRCLLCQRQFKTIEVLRRHVVESDLHKRNLANEDACKAGRERRGHGKTETPPNMKKAGFAPVLDKGKDVADDNLQSDAPQYRDRASERRAVFGVEARPKAWQGPKVMRPVLLKETEAALKQKQPSPEAETRPALDESSVGGSLLAKMGWQAGSGLGASKSGRVAPVEARVYVQGAGLGSVRSRPESIEEHAAKRARQDQGSYGGDLQDRTRMRFAKASDQ